MWLKFIKKYVVRNVNLPLFYYRQHQNSLTNNSKRILFNRSRIIRKLQKKENTKKIVALLPIRGLKLSPDSMVLTKLNKKPLVFYTIDSILSSKLISKLIITSPDSKLLNFIKKKYKEKVLVINRPENLGFINTELEKTIRHSLKVMKSKKIDFDYMMNISFRTPFISSKVIEDGINTIQLFDSDKIICVTQETHKYYRHDGSGLKSLIKSSNLKLERDVIYKQVMGFNIVKKNCLFKNDENLKIGHISLTNEQSFEINNEKDLEMIERHKLYKYN